MGCAHRYALELKVAWLYKCHNYLDPLAKKTKTYWGGAWSGRGPGVVTPNIAVETPNIAVETSNIAEVSKTFKTGQNRIKPKKHKLCMSN